MFADVLRFYRDARARLDAGRASPTLGEYLDELRFGRGFRAHFLSPITSAVWSTASDRIHHFPIDYLLRFLDHHGLIGVGRALQWRTISGGSMTYVERILERLGPRFGPCRATRSSTSHGRRTASPSGRPPVRTTGSTPSCSRRTPTTRSRLLPDADETERAALGAFEYSTNRVVLHADPTRPAAPSGRLGVVERRPAATAGGRVKRSR